MAFSEDRPYFSFIINSSMRCVQNDDISIFGAMTWKSIPPRCTSQWKSSKTTEWKGVAESLRQQVCNLNPWVMIELIWTRTFCIDCVWAGKPSVFQFFCDFLFYFNSWEISMKMLSKSGFALFGLDRFISVMWGNEYRLILSNVLCWTAWCDTHCYTFIFLIFNIIKNIKIFLLYKILWTKSNKNIWFLMKYNFFKF